VAATFVVLLLGGGAPRFDLPCRSFTAISRAGRLRDRLRNGPKRLQAPISAKSSL
jgi:hypothetical protein